MRVPLDAPRGEVDVAVAGDGPPVVLLHGGWGRGYYPFDLATRALVEAGHRVLAPDRLGFARSSPVDEVPVDFHVRAARETLAILDALGVDEARLWGHSDGAVIALHLARLAPRRFPALAVEAAHLWRRKPASRRFFETMADAPESFGEKVARRLETEHGARWRDILRLHGRAWLRLADEARDERHDLYDNRLADVRAPALVVHGARDPRTEPGELDALLAALPRATPLVFPEAGHAPHAERATEAQTARRVVSFFATHSS